MLRVTVSHVNLPEYQEPVIDLLWQMGVFPTTTLHESDACLELFTDQHSELWLKAREQGLPTIELCPAEKPGLKALLLDVMLAIEPLLPQEEKKVSTLQPADVRLENLPEPPLPYIAHSYILTRQFFGRGAELDLLNAWAASDDGMMIVEAIGGMGKSALTWEWVSQHAERTIPDLGGLLWWSFYESDATISNLLRHLLVYTTRRPAEEIDVLNFDARLTLLKQALGERPYLIVLDGLERILTAYHRMDAPHLLDEKINAMQQDIHLRGCTDPRHAILLKVLAACSPSKVLVSTRLMPSDLQQADSQPMPGVQHHNLAGLLDADVLEMLHHYQIQGDTAAMQHFATLLENHSLLIGVAAGRIQQDAEGDFDQWWAQQQSKLDLENCDLPERRTRLLQYALSCLPQASRKLLGQLAAFRYPVDHRALVALTPSIPTPPIRPVQLRNYEAQITRHREAVERAERTSSMALKDHHERQLKLAEEQFQRLSSEYEAELQKYAHSLERREAWLQLHLALREMEQLGLLSWDRFSNRYDIHPVLRAYALDVLPQEDRLTTYQHISDYFKGIPPEDLNQVTEISDLRRSFEIYHALVNAEMLEEAAALYANWKDILMYRLEAYHLIAEMLTPIFRDGIDKLPPLRNPETVLFNLASSHYHVGNTDKSLMLHHLSLKMYMDQQDAASIARTLFNLENSYRQADQYFNSHKLALLQLELSLALQNKERITMSWLSLLKSYRDIGQFPYAQEIYKTLLAEPHYRKKLSWQSETDWHFATALFIHEQPRARFLAELALEEAFAAEDMLVIRALQKLVGLIALRDNELEKAENHLMDHITRSKKSGMSGKAGYAALARLRVAQGRIEEALELAKLDFSALDNAMLYHALNQPDKAKDYARQAYEKAWADGLPFSDWENLSIAQKILEEYSEPLPQLPPFADKTFEPLPFEAEIRAFIPVVRSTARRQRLSSNLRNLYWKAAGTRLKEFGGMPVREWEPDQPAYDFANTIYRISLSTEVDEARWTDKFAAYLESDQAQQTCGLVVGNWERAWQEASAARVIEAIVIAAHRLPHLKALMLGNSNETEPLLTDISPLFEAYPQLEYMGVRGNRGLRFGTLAHQQLKSFMIQTGGMEREVIQELAETQLPALEHLDIWLGTQGQGATVTIDDLRLLLTKKKFPKLKHLALKNSDLSDEIPQVIVDAKLKIKTLDLSLGNLGDMGAAVLIEKRLPSLKKLILHHHYCSPEMLQKLKLAGIKVEQSQAHQEDLYTTDLSKHYALHQGKQ